MKKWKESKLYYKLKQIKVNRAIYLSAIVILLALAVVLAITAATNRAKKKGTEFPSDESTVTEPPVTDPSGDTPTNQPDVPTNALPEFSLPVSGKLLKPHSSDMQVFSQTMQDYRVHLGIDITTAEAAEVFAPADGVIQKIWEDPMMGWCVAISHSGDCVTVYKNLAKDLAQGLSEGISVKQGQLLGTVGDSAMIEIAEEPHLHMEMTINGLQVNPLDYFSASVIASLAEDTSFENVSTGK